MGASTRWYWSRAVQAAVFLGGCALSYYLGTVSAQEPMQRAKPLKQDRHVPVYLRSGLEESTDLVPLLLHKMYHTTARPGLAALYIHLLFVNAYHLDGEFDMPVSLLLGICEKNPEQFFSVATTKVARDVYDSWLHKIPSACFTDFPGDRDLQMMEERRVRICARLRETDLDDAKQDAMREELIALLQETEVRRVE